MERLLGLSPVTTAHGVWSKPYGNGEDCIVGLLLYCVSREIRTNFVRTNVLGSYVNTGGVKFVRISHKFHGNSSEFILFFILFYRFFA